MVGKCVGSALTLLVACGCANRSFDVSSPFDSARSRVQIVAETDLFVLVHFARVLEEAAVLSDTLSVTDSTREAQFLVEVAPRVRTRGRRTWIGFDVYDRRFAIESRVPMLRAEVSCGRNEILRCAADALSRVERVIGKASGASGPKQ